MMHGLRQIKSPTEPGCKQNKKESPLKGPNVKGVVDAGELPSPDSKQGKTGVGSNRESNASREYVLSQVSGGTIELKILPTPIDLFEDECVFCHSFRTSEFHGPMVRYLKGRVVSIDEDNSSNAIYVHKKCIEWAPRVWFDGDIVMNLESEIRRASRLRCRKCGLLGAALGCFYDRCNKSFHVPCAAQIIDCRWDVDKSHVLCPEHVSERLPCDGPRTHAEQNDNCSNLRGSPYIVKKENFDDHGSESQQAYKLNIPYPSYMPQSQPSIKEVIFTSSSRDGQQIYQLDTSSSSSPLGQHSDDEGISKNSERSEQRTHNLNTSNLSSLPQRSHPDKEGISNAHQGRKIKDQPAKSSWASDQLVLLGLYLSVSEKDSLQVFACWTNAMLTKEWAKNVTHVIVGKCAGSSWSRSFEVLMAILLGKWVVHFEWIAACSTRPPCPEASYEVALGRIDGPKKGRIRAARRAPNLFSGLCFCLSSYMNPGNRDRTRDLIVAAGGRVLEKRDLHLLPKNPDGSPANPYFVYDVDAPREFSASSLRKEIQEAREHAAAGAQVTSHHRVLDAIAAYDAEILNVKNGHFTS